MDQLQALQNYVLQQEGELWENNKPSTQHKGLNQLFFLYKNNVILIKLLQGVETALDGMLNLHKKNNCVRNLPK